ncbi:hypothetical protein Ddye_020844 [Dipteronia dyeriana]|uniref:Uncharacterized protein n=1 Tax=Dipteronia dyeriana TaxID=168575 RepID=A0AAD9U1K4_9ROSI|nr:hypothetical protein Ddye_020844 [Dipteronia dyeriana]
MRCFCSLKQCMGLGLTVSCMSKAMAALVETKRRNTAIREGLEDKPGGVVSMSTMWLVSQYILIGVAKALTQSDR